MKQPWATPLPSLTLGKLYGIIQHWKKGVAGAPGATYFVSTGFFPGIRSKQQDFYRSFCCGKSLFLISHEVIFK